MPPETRDYLAQRLDGARDLYLLALALGERPAERRGLRRRVPAGQGYSRGATYDVAEGPSFPPRASRALMRLSHLFARTLRDAPQDAEIESHKLLTRAAYIRQLASGVFTLLPFGLRSARKIENILREEMNAIGGQELMMPVVQPATIWQQTGRWYQVGEELLRFKDRFGRDMVLGMTHEEVVADLARQEVQSYKQLPMLVYQIQTKYRDEPRSRAGLLRVREFVMKDAYSMDVDYSGLEKHYRTLYESYFRIFDRVGLTNVIAVKSDTGMMGGKIAHEFMFLFEGGEDTIVLCDACEYASNLQVARFQKAATNAEAARQLERVQTPRTTTIEDLATLLKISPAQTLKAVLYSAAISVDAKEQTAQPILVMALVRGDMEVSETKLAGVIRSQWLKPASEADIRAAGVIPGYASPIGLGNSGVLVVADDLVPQSQNLVAGANAEDYHVVNANYGRDYTAQVVADISSAFNDAPCPQCGAPLRLTRGVEIGNIFQLGTRYTEAMGACFLDETGETRPIVMGSYGIGVGRTLACVAEACHDQRGLVMPISVAPFVVHLVALAAADQGSEVQSMAESLYEAFLTSGLETLYDDRALSPGTKFADADLIGIPLRVTVSARSIRSGGVEIKRRDQQEQAIVPADDAVTMIANLIGDLHSEADVQLRHVNPG